MCFEYFHYHLAFTSCFQHKKDEIYIYPWDSKKYVRTARKNSYQCEVRREVELRSFLIFVDVERETLYMRTRAMQLHESSGLDFCLYYSSSWWCYGCWCWRKIFWNLNLHLKYFSSSLLAHCHVAYDLCIIILLNKIKMKKEKNICISHEGIWWPWVSLEWMLYKIFFRAYEWIYYSRYHQSYTRRKRV